MLTKLIFETILFICVNAVFLVLKINNVNFIVLVVAEIVFVCYILPQKLKKDQTFNLDSIPTREYKIFWYYLPYLYGYRSFDTVFVPIVAQVRLYRIGWYTFPNNTIKDKDFEYNIHKSIKNTKSLSILVADTYPINTEQMPTELRDEDSIKIERTNSTNERGYSSELVSIFKKVFMENLNTYEEINIIFATNPKTIQEIVTQTKDGRTNKLINILHCPLSDNGVNYTIKGSKSISMKKTRIKDYI